MRQSLSSTPSGALPNGKAIAEPARTGFYLIIYTDELAHHWAHVMYDARRVGRRLEAADAWIAATARHLNAPLLTHDRDFSPEACPSITILCRA